MKIPGPDHPISITPASRRVRAKVGGHVIADTAEAVILKEATYPAVPYLPRDDVEMGFLSKTDHHTYCPYKGEASYYNLHIDGELRENVVWSYEDPYPAMQEIKGRLAFYPNKVEIYEVDPEV
jgi:uncharacterized protein (DUF427 family)